jgi:hypothetical protein
MGEIKQKVTTNENNRNSIASITKVKSKSNSPLSVRKKVSVNVIKLFDFLFNILENLAY